VQDQHALLLIVRAGAKQREQAQRDAKHSD